MNLNKTILAILLLVGTFLTSAIAMTSCVYRRGNNKRGDGNKQRVEDASAGVRTDCDTRSLKTRYD